MTTASFADGLVGARLAPPGNRIELPFSGFAQGAGEFRMACRRAFRKQRLIVNGFPNPQVSKNDTRVPRAGG